MCSLKLPEPTFSPENGDELLGAITDVAERSFFAMADPCDAARFGDLAGAQQGWLVATVRFEEGCCRGRVACTLPRELAHVLFDAFSGRDPSDAPPEPDQLLDLIGEFTNMVCGAWLTRAATEQAFNLRKPTVEVMPDGWTPPPGSEAAVTVALDDLPLAVEVCLDAITEPETRLAQA